jgi:hypothetical protein
MMRVEALTNFMEQSPSLEANSSFYGTERFINMFTKAGHWTLTCSHLHILFC